MKGPHDHELIWLLNGNFRVALLNQISDREHHSVVFSLHEEFSSNPIGGRVTNGDVATRGWGTDMFVSNKDKSTPICQFLKCLHYLEHL